MARPNRVRPRARLRSEGSRSAGVPAGVRSRGRVASRRPDARPADSHHRRHTHGRERIALPPDPVGRPQRRVPRTRRRLRHDARAARRTARRTAEVRRQRLPRTAHPARDHADSSRRRPQRSEHADTDELVERLHAVNARAIRPHRSIAPAQPHRPAVLHPRTRRLVPHRGRSHRNTPPPRRDSTASPSRPPGTSPPPSAHTLSCCR